MARRRTVRTLCICATHIIDVEVEGNEVVKVSMAPIPENRGDNLCSKGREVPRWNWRTVRVTYPMIRRGKGGPWRRVSWDEALDTVTERLMEIRRNYGPEVLWTGQSSGIKDNNYTTYWYMSEFLAGFGSPNWGTYAENCYNPRVLSSRLSFGERPLAADLDPEARPGSIFLWGSNPSAACPPVGGRILKFKREKGTKLVVIDPRKIPLAKQADLYLPVRPGTDTALALAMINVIIEEGIYDREFVEGYTFGFDKLVEHVKRYRPEYLARTVDVPASLIRDAARIFATSKPTIVERFMGFEGSPNGFEAHRAVDILLAITGNVDNESGNIFPEPNPAAVLRRRELPPGGLGLNHHPLWVNYNRRIVSNAIADAVLTGKPYPLRALFIVGANPAVVMANSSHFQEALRQPDVFVVHEDIRFNETSEFADVFLPAQTFLEKEDVGTFICMYDLDLMWTTKKVLEPPGETLPDWEIWRRLCKRFGIDVPDTLEETWDKWILPETMPGITFDELRKKPVRPDRTKVQKYKKRGFKTPSGKVEIYSTILEEYGHNPLPDFMEHPESTVSLPHLAREYPLVLITFRVPHYWHTQNRDVPNLRKLDPESSLEINPRDAERYGIADGDWVLVEGLRGTAEARAKVTKDMKEGVVGMVVGWGGKGNPDLLSSDEPRHRDPVTGGAMLRGFLCRVRKA